MAEWYYAQDEEQHGPVSAAALKQMAQQGKIGRDDLIWREGMRRWAPAHKVRGLFSEDNSSHDKLRRAATNGSPETGDDSGGEDAASNTAAQPGASEPISDVLPVDGVDVVDDALEAEELDDDDESGSVSEDDETAIDVLPLGGPEESKLHVPVLTAPEGAPISQRSASDEIVVFEPAGAPPPPPARKAAPNELDQARTHDSDVRRHTRIDVPAGGGWSAGVGLFLQTFTWASCLLVIVVGGVAYLSALMMTSDASQRLAASGIYATFVVASYFLARSTERICRACEQWLGASSQRRTRHSVRERNWQRFQ